MDPSNPIGSVIPSAHGPVLTVLARTDRPMSGRQTAALVGGRVTQSRVNSILQALTEAGIVLCEEHPPARLYRLNRDHVAAGAIAALAGLRDELLSRMRQHIVAWPVQPAAVWLFGSAARGDGGPRSDIDVLAVRHRRVEEEDPRWIAQLESFATDVRAWAGNECRVIEYGEDEFGDLEAAGERLAAEIHRDGIHLAGARVTGRRRPIVTDR
ncbi:MAG: nucleotidyltransferase family protein [Acidimicrobiia bacterium]